jgi:uncharacterized coiled-coil DUF342 family protein
MTKEFMMKIIFSILTLALVLSPVLQMASAQEMTRDEWQAEMNKYTEMRDQTSTKVKSQTDENAALKAKSTQLDADLQKCMDELYALVGSNSQEAAAYRAQIDAADQKANDLMRLSDSDLMARSGEVNELDASVKKLWENTLSVIPEFYDRLTALNEKVKSLQTTLAGSGKMYTVGTWARNRDCLWNISKKKDIYNNAWMWPKIWQGNRDQIKDPDVIHPGQKLKIPAAGAMTSDEKSAAKRYYSTKGGQ